MTPDARSRLAVAIHQAIISNPEHRQAAAVIEAIETEFVVIERGRWNRVRRLTAEGIGNGIGPSAMAWLEPGDLEAE